MYSEKTKAPDLTEPLLSKQDFSEATGRDSPTPGTTLQAKLQVNRDLFEDSEDEAETPENGPNKLKPDSDDAPKSCFTELKDFLVMKYRRMIFFQMNKFFKEDFKKAMEKTPPIPKQLQVPHHLKNFEEKCREIDSETLEKSLRENKELLDELAKNIHRPVQLIKIVRRTIQSVSGPCSSR